MSASFKETGTGSVGLRKNLAQKFLQLGKKLRLTLLIITTNNSLQAQCLKITAITDGDTFKVTIPHLPPTFGENLPVRLYGVDAPEMKAKRRCERIAAIEARYFVKNKLESAKCITLYSMKRDKYFRLLAKVDVDGVDLSQSLLDKKLAAPYFGKTKPKWVCSAK